MSHAGPRPSGDGAHAGFAEVERLFQAARRLDPGGRDALLAAADPAVRDEVRALLAEHDAGDDAFLDAPALGAGFRVADADTVTAGLPRTIGRYRILGIVGEGGMGTVYLAEQDHPRRAVALKVIRPGATTPALRRRFAQEAEVLGRLRHPGIAQVYEAGVADDGLPFIAMERIDGPPLLEYVQAEGLDTRRRLELFVRIGDAVEHAHGKGVVHRDLKPGNILVETTGTSTSIDGDGGTAADTTNVQPKILDFGIARVTDSDLAATTQVTRAGQLVGTLQYMSPEQAAGNVADIDARSDVYSLGLLLFELLTGRPPLDLSGRTMPEAVRILQQDEPSTLASVDPGLADDLGTIVTKALEKDRGRRYPSAAAMVADVRRFLSDQPILAHPPSALYQLRKFARRHRGLVTLVAAVFVSLSLGLAATFVQWQQTRVARDLAEQRFDDLNALANDFINEVDTRLLHVAGSLPARRAIVETALKYLDPLAAEAGADEPLLATLVKAYARVGDIQGLPRVPNLGDHAGAATSYGRALSLLGELEALVGPQPAILDDRHNLLARLATLAKVDGDMQRALDLFGQAQAAWLGAQAHVEPDARPPLPLRERVADVLIALGRTAEGDEQVRLAAEESARWAAQNPDDWNARRGLLVARMRLAVRKEAAGQPEQSLPDYVECVALAEELLADQPHNVVLQRDLATSHNRWRDVLLELGRRDEADVHHALATAGYERILAAAPDDAQALMDVCMTVNVSGELALADGHTEQARAHFERFADIAGRLVALDPERPDYLRRQGVALFKLGEYHAARAADQALSADQRRDRWAAARERFVRCLEHFLDMQSHGKLAAADAEVPDEIRARIRACNLALAAP